MLLMKTAPTVEGLTTGPALDGLAAAPTVAEIMADPARMERCAAAMMYVFARPEASSFIEDPNKFEVQEVSEADVLHDLVSFVAESDTRDRPEDRAFVAQLPQATFIDTEAMNHGARAIAHHWATLLGVLPGLNVMVDEGKSAITVFDRAISIIERESPDLLPRILPIRRSRDTPPPSDELVARLRTGHTALVDDWASTARQMNDSVELLRKLGIPATNLEVNLVCAPRSLLDNGIGGVACRSAFCMPEPVPKRPGEHGTNTPSVAGAHSLDDDGFKWRINDAFPHDADGAATRRPLIVDLAKGYGGHVWYAGKAPDGYWEQVVRLQRRTASIAETLGT
jgi:hypothetical protein